jgi:hypothetical protein
MAREITLILISENPGLPKQYKYISRIHKQTHMGRIHIYTAQKGYRSSLAPSIPNNFIVRALARCNRLHRAWLHLPYKKRWVTKCKCKRCKR